MQAGTAETDVELALLGAVGGWVRDESGVMPVHKILARWNCDGIERQRRLRVPGLIQLAAPDRLVAVARLNARVRVRKWFAEQIPSLEIDSGGLARKIVGPGGSRRDVERGQIVSANLDFALKRIIEVIG
jgi:hypothetical protein